MEALSEKRDKHKWGFFVVFLLFVMGGAAGGGFWGFVAGLALFMLSWLADTMDHIVAIADERRTTHDR